MARMYATFPATPDYISKRVEGIVWILGYITSELLLPEAESISWMNRVQATARRPAPENRILRIHAPTLSVQCGLDRPCTLPYFQEWIFTVCSKQAQAA